MKRLLNITSAMLLTVVAIDSQAMEMDGSFESGYGSPARTIGHSHAPFTPGNPSSPMEGKSLGSYGSPVSPETKSTIKSPGWGVSPVTEGSPILLGLSADASSQLSEDGQSTASVLSAARKVSTLMNEGKEEESIHEEIRYDLFKVLDALAEREIDIYTFEKLIKDDEAIENWQFVECNDEGKLAITTALYDTRICAEAVAGLIKVFPSIAVPTEDGEYKGLVTIAMVNACEDRGDIEKSIINAAIREAIRNG